MVEVQLALNPFKEYEIIPPNEVNIITAVDVPTALIILNPINIINIGTKTTPPPTPRSPDNNPVINPINI